jgi:hypothetical protein
LQIISDRLLTIIVLAMTFALAWYTIIQPELIRLGTTLLFSIFSYLIVKTKEGKQNGLQDE